MDRWTLVIHGQGPHHSGAPGDVDSLAAAIVRDLRAGGHSEVIATLGHNQCEVRIEPAPDAVQVVASDSGGTGKRLFKSGPQQG